jgi:hypothetical protein
VWLRRPPPRLTQDLAIDSAALRASGCRTLNFGGKPVIEVCFKREGRWFHLYAIRVSDLPDGRDDPAPMMLARDRYDYASWRKAVTGVWFIAATAGEGAEPSRLLSCLDAGAGVHSARNGKFPAEAGIIMPPN